MKNIYLFLVFILVTIMSPPGKIAAQSLYPPTNLNAVFIEDAVYLTWLKPQNPMGQTPAGLIGYRVYRQGIQIGQINDPDTLGFYDMTVDTSGYYTYGVTAYYDMTPYGNPGVFQESVPGEITIYYQGPYCVMPFYEPWNSGNFSYNDWKLEPASSNNWSVATSTGNPAPTAMFGGSPVVTNYSHLMKSIQFGKSHTGCSRYFLDFDYKLEDVSADSTEKLTAGIFHNSSWYEAIVFKNKGTTDWIHVSVEVTNFIYSEFRIGFTASGVNSSHISSWMVDNIHLYGLCGDPLELQAEVNQNVVTLTWEPPACTSYTGLLGYDIWRTDPSGLPPFYRLNTSPVTALEYSDVLPANTPPGTLKYRVTALFKDTITGNILCESPGTDTVQVDYRLGVPKTEGSGVKVSPNPASTFIRVTSDILLNGYQLFNSCGSAVAGASIPDTKEIEISVKSLKAGIYFLRVKDVNGKTGSERVVIK